MTTLRTLSLEAICICFPELNIFECVVFQYIYEDYMECLKENKPYYTNAEIIYKKYKEKENMVYNLNWRKITRYMFNLKKKGYIEYSRKGARDKNDISKMHLTITDKAMKIIDLIEEGYDV